MRKFDVKKLFFSDLILNSSKTRTIAYVGVLTAFSVISNMFLEFRMFDIQFSITIFVAFAIGAYLGSLAGFCSLFLGDLIGYLINSFGQLYMPWVGLSTGLIAFIAGLIINGIKLDIKGEIYIKIAISALLTFIICTVLINSTGFYFYNYKMGFSAAVIDYVESTFGGEVGYFSYLAYRLIFKLQIVNSIFNYALCFALLPFLLKLKDNLTRKKENE